MDFYVVLGVQREASEGDIKRAYRRLARRWHPDINPGDREAAVRFRQVLDAYETLIDPDRRRRYDSGHGSGTPADEAASFGFTGFDFSTQVHAERTTTFGELFEEVFVRRVDPRVAPEAGSDIHAQTSVTFEEAWHGVDRLVTLTRHTPALAARAAASTALPRRGACRVKARARSARCAGTWCSPRTARGAPAPACCGRNAARAARGRAWRRAPRSSPCACRPASPDGARVRVAGKGHAGVRGGAPGDLYLDVHVEEHPTFRRDGDDVHMILPIAVHEAGLGTKIDVATPDGAVRVRVPPGTQSGQRFRLRERGVPTRNGGKGDLVVEVRLALPKVLDERSKELLREFGRINGESVRN